VDALKGRKSGGRNGGWNDVVVGNGRNGVLDGAREGRMILEVRARLVDGNKDMFGDWRVSVR
jgi:hypothetical protein